VQTAAALGAIVGRFQKDELFQVADAGRERPDQLHVRQEFEFAECLGHRSFQLIVGDNEEAAGIVPVNWLPPSCTEFR
jgi:hypothetical protein